MSVQSFVFPNEVCSETELFYRNGTDIKIRGGKDPERLILDPGAVLSSDTYMNFFDKTAWRKYTRITNVELIVSLKGKGTVELYEDDILSQAVSYNGSGISEIRLSPDMKNDGICYFEIRAEEETEFYLAEYVVQDQNHEEKIQQGQEKPQQEQYPDKQPREVRLALLICTYHREGEVISTLKALCSSLFFDPGSEYYGKLYIYITDNGSTLNRDDILQALGNREDIDGHLCIKQSKNAGGSGGFTRCILKMREDHDRSGVTHAVFMDDDSLFIPETFYRLYTLLSYIKPEYSSEVISGRKFRIDQRYIQYTASEIWNKGDLIHGGFEEDMREKGNLAGCNAERGEYAGFWFAAYPYRYTAHNLPLPFFIHCDDVEFGLRHRGTPIVLNGIQVWHETGDQPSSPVITYYDLKNTLTVDAIFGLLPDKDTLIKGWKKRISGEHVKKKYVQEYMLIKALNDFLKGKRYFLRRDTEREYRRLIKSGRKRGIRLSNIFFWRFTVIKTKLFYDINLKTYLRQEKRHGQTQSICHSTDL